MPIKLTATYETHVIPLGDIGFPIQQEGGTVVLSNELAGGAILAELIEEFGAEYIAMIKAV